MYLYNSGDNLEVGTLPAVSDAFPFYVSLAQVTVYSSQSFFRRKSMKS